MKLDRRSVLTGVVGSTVATVAAPTLAQKKYDDGVTDTQIKLGNTAPYSGPASAYSAVSKTMTAYFKATNEAGGIGGRTIRFISGDDALSPPKTVELVRQYVENEKIFALVGSVGTPTNQAIHKYMNTKRVPQLYIYSGSSKWGDPKRFPWTMGFMPTYRTEGAVYAKHILATVREPKIGVLMQNDDAGRDFLDGLKEGLGEEARRITQVATYELSDPTVDSQIIGLKSTDANVLVCLSGAKFTAQAIRKTADIGWKPRSLYIISISASVAAVMKPAGIENSQGIISAAFLMDPTDPQWAENAEMQTWRSWMTKTMPDANKDDVNYVYGYAISSLVVETIRRCGNELTRENLMKQAASLHNVRVPLLLPHIVANTSSTDYFPIKSMQLQRFKGETWQLFGDIISTENK